MTVLRGRRWPVLAGAALAVLAVGALLNALSRPASAPPAADAGSETQAPAAPVPGGSGEDSGEHVTCGERRAHLGEA